MNANDVNLVINNICEKLGIGINNIEQLVPELVKMQIANNIICSICFGVLTVILVKIAMSVVRKAKDVDRFYRDDVYIGAGALGIISVIGFIITMTQVADTIMWILAPRAMSIKYMLEMIK